MVDFRIENYSINWMPRPYQLPFLEAMKGGKKRAILVWHRRSGKTITLLNYCIDQMIQKPGILIWHVFPTFQQARKAIWDGRDRKSKKPFIKYFPEWLLAKEPNNSNMSIEFKSKDSNIANSRYQLIGSDNYNSLVGSGPDVLIMDEFSLQDPEADVYFSPMMAENEDAVEIYCFTPRGHNHAYELLKREEKNNNWFVSKLTVEQTTDIYGMPIINQTKINEDKERGMSDGKIRQEYYVDFEGATDGCYYANQMIKADAEGRIGKVPYITSSPVYTFWDLGSANPAIWFVQKIGMKICFIDYHAGYHTTFDEYKKIFDDKGYAYMEHYMPHDAAVHDMSAPGGKNRKQSAEAIGIKPIKTVERPNNRAAVMAGIEAVRSQFNQFWFDEEKCKTGISALRAYHADYDENKKVIEDSPIGDWSSHPADAIRLLATSDFLLPFVEKKFTPIETKGTWGGQAKITNTLDLLKDPYGKK